MYKRIVFFWFLLVMVLVIAQRADAQGNLKPKKEVFKNEKITFYGNSPNPFNQTTVFEMKTKYDCTVRIDVYNILGSKVGAVKKSFKMRDGFVSFERGNLPVGLYFFRLYLNDEYMTAGSMSIID